jgi:hypothetical protein
MADLMFMYATTAGFFIGFGVLLFVVRQRRPREAKASIAGQGDKGRTVKRYDSNGKPIYD